MVYYSCDPQNSPPQGISPPYASHLLGKYEDFPLRKTGMAAQLSFCQNLFLFLVHLVVSLKLVSVEEKDVEL